jgi:hypothetical protein
MLPCIVFLNAPTYFATAVSYACKKIIKQRPEANVTKLFRRNYVAMSVTSVKILSEYATSGVNYAKNSFIILATEANVIILFYSVIYEFS